MPVGKTRRSRTVAVVFAAVLALSASGCQRPVGGDASAAKNTQHNVAVIDATATNEALGAVEQALEAVFSYDTDNLGPHSAAVRKYLTRSMRQDIKKLLPKLDKQHGIVIDSKVTASAAAKVTASRAVVLGFITQTSTRKATKQQSKGLSPVSVTAVRSNGGWKLAKIKAPAVTKLSSPATRGPEGVRDAAVSAARELASVSLSLDPADPEGTLASWRKTATGSWLKSLQSRTAELVEQIAAAKHRVSATAQAAAASKLDASAGRATVLLTAEVVTEGQGTKMMAFRTVVWKESGKWKLAHIEQVEPA